MHITKLQTSVFLIYASQVVASVRAGRAACRSTRLSLAQNTGSDKLPEHVVVMPMETRGGVQRRFLWVFGAGRKMRWLRNKRACWLLGGIGQSWNSGARRMHVLLSQDDLSELLSIVDTVWASEVPIPFADPSVYKVWLNLAAVRLERIDLQFNRFRDVHPGVGLR